MGLRSSKATRRLILSLAILLLAALVQRSGLDWSRADSSPDPSPGAGSRVASLPVLEDASDGARILRGFEDRRSGFMATVDGRVAKLLPDDRDGSRHQRFLIELPGGHTLLVAHNVDLAERVPLERGDRVRVRGQYEWNERGGVLHWTHHDPARRHEGGWIEHEGTRVD